jgi:Golgi SNAP receptor complex protein 2
MLVSELLPEDARRLHELELKLEQLDLSPSGGTGTAPAPSYGGSAAATVSLAADIHIGLQEMERRLKDLDALSKKESKAQRDVARRRLVHMRTSFDHVTATFNTLLRKKGINKTDFQKKALFGSYYNCDGTLENLDLEMAENSSLNRSAQMLDDYLASGRSALEELVGQRERLKNAQRKVYDILNLLGISNTIMKNVENREAVDRLIVFAGMILISILLLLIYLYR